MYIAIIGDVKSSKTLVNRNDVQEKLKKVLNNVNSLYSENIAAKFLITLGDEFQGLLFYTEKMIQIIKYIQREMYPIKIRFGVGIGAITTRIDKEAAIGADGPAFYAARNTISMLHDCEKRLKKQAPDIQVSKYDEDIFEITEVNTLLTLIKAIEDSWTEKQRYTIWDMMDNHGSQEACAERLKASQSTIARRLADGKYVVYVNALKIIEEAIGKMEEKGVI